MMAFVILYIPLLFSGVIYHLLTLPANKDKKGKKKFSFNLFVTRSMYLEQKALRVSAEELLNKVVILYRKNERLVKLLRIELSNADTELKKLRQQVKSQAQDKTNSQFTKEELNKLIMLCHPDKHNGKQMANELTSKLIKIRNS